MRYLLIRHQDALPLKRASLKSVVANNENVPHKPTLHVMGTDSHRSFPNQKTMMPWKGYVMLLKNLPAAR